MTKVEKTATIAELKERFSNSSFFYLTDASTLTVEKTNKLRRLCFEKGVEMRVIKNTLVKKALEDAPASKGYAPLLDSLHGPTAVLFSETANLAAKLIKDFRQENARPILKAAYIDSDVFVGDDQIDVLCKLKSKEELVGEVIAMLQSPIQTVLSQLESGGSTIAGLLKTLEERG